MKAPGADLLPVSSPGKGPGRQGLKGDHAQAGTWGPTGFCLALPWEPERPRALRETTCPGQRAPQSTAVATHFLLFCAWNGTRLILPQMSLHYPWLGSHLSAQLDLTLYPGATIVHAHLESGKNDLNTSLSFSPG